MKKVKAITHKEVLKKWMKDPEFAAGIKIEKRKLDIKVILRGVKTESRLTNEEIAERMHVDVNTVSNLENNPFDEKFDTIFNYLLACNKDMGQMLKIYLSVE